jgi:hypothetical protein
MLERPKPGLHATIIYGFVVLVFGAYFFIRDNFHLSSVQLQVLNHTPETLVIIAVLALRRLRLPWFPAGNFLATLKQYPLIWLALIPDTFTSQITATAAVGDVL